MTGHTPWANIQHKARPRHPDGRRLTFRAVDEIARWQLVLRFTPLVDRSVLTKDEAVQQATLRYFATLARA